MKIKYNIPMLNKLKNRVNSFKLKLGESIEKIKRKIENNNVNNSSKKVSDNLKEKVKANRKLTARAYGLLFLMILLGFTTLTHNIKEYTKINKENYTEYTLEDKIQNSRELESTNKSNNDNNSVVIASNEKVYLTAESSIKTENLELNEKNNNDEAVETISANVEVNNDTSNSKEKYNLPVNGTISKEFAMDKLVYSKTLEMWKTHPGIDIECDIDSKVKAVEEGVVLEVTNDSFYGNTVKIQKDNLIFIYSNLNEDILVSIGENVKVGQVIGSVGISAKGEILDETHLHFEILRNEKNINPLELLKIQE